MPRSSRSAPRRPRLDALLDAARGRRRDHARAGAVPGGQARLEPGGGPRPPRRRVPEQLRGHHTAAPARRGPTPSLRYVRAYCQARLPLPHRCRLRHRASCASTPARPTEPSRADLGAVRPADGRHDVSEPRGHALRALTCCIGSASCRSRSRPSSSSISRRWRRWSGRASSAASWRACANASGASGPCPTPSSTPITTSGA